MYCKGCGFALGDPEEDLHDPEGLSDVAQDLGIAPENEDAHLVVRDGEKGWRYYCSELGQVTSIVAEPPGEDKGNREGEGAPPKEQAEQEERQAPKGGSGGRKVYDIPEEKSPITVLADVVTSPFLGLNEDQVNEVRDWAEDYDGQLPPDMLESILANMSGVQKQAAALARQKYEVKLNKWVQEQAQGDEGPPIGVTAQPPKRGRGGRSRGGRGRRGGEGGGSSERQPPPGGRGGEPPDDMPEDLRRYRRVRRTERRNDAADVAMETAAKEIAREIGPQFASNFGRYFSLPAKILEAKAEKDPDWFFEKLEQWDIDIDDVLEPSQSRKEDMRQQNESPVDREADEALDRLRDDEGDMEQDDFFDDEEGEMEEVEDEDGIFDDVPTPSQGGG